MSERPTIPTTAIDPVMKQPRTLVLVARPESYFPSKKSRRPRQHVWTARTTAPRWMLGQ